MNVAKHLSALFESCSGLQCSQISSKNKRFKTNCSPKMEPMLDFFLDINWIKFSYRQPSEFYLLPSEITLSEINGICPPVSSNGNSLCEIWSKKVLFCLLKMFLEVRA